MSSSVVFIHGLWIHSLSWQPWRELFEELLGRGLAAAVAISPAPIRGVRALPLSLLRARFPVLSRPGNRRGAVSLTEKQFAYSFGNALPADESAQLYGTLTIPASTANFRRHSPTAVGATSVEPHTFDDRGHSAPFDHGWRELADFALAWHGFQIPHEFR